MRGRFSGQSIRRVRQEEKEKREKKREESSRDTREACTARKTDTEERKTEETW